MMEANRYGEILCGKIAELRRKNGLTQEALADRLGITFQAVSKWETGQSCPDITLLPELAAIFGTEIDALFGMERKAPEPPAGTEISSGLPWEDDGVLRAAAFIGRRLVKKPAVQGEEFTFEYKGAALNVESQFSISCGDVEGDASAGSSISCGDVGGKASAGSSISCGNVGDKASAGSSISCGNVSGKVSAGSSISCGNVEESVAAGKSVSCGNVGGGVSAGSRVECGDIKGGIKMEKGQVVCKSIDGKTVFNYENGQVASVGGEETSGESEKPKKKFRLF